jgi:hypothetical protein
MSYRAYLRKINKEDLEVLQTLASKNTDYITTTPMASVSLCEIDHLDASDTNTLTNVYSSEIEEGELYIISKTQLASIIEKEGKKIGDFYSGLINQSGDYIQNDSNIKSLLSTKKSTWNNSYMLEGYTLEGNEVTRSWLREYSIFNFVHIYKSIDWNKEFLLYSAY